MKIFLILCPYNVTIYLIWNKTQASLITTHPNNSYNTLKIYNLLFIYVNKNTPLLTIARNTITIPVSVSHILFVKSVKLLVKSIPSGLEN